MGKKDKPWEEPKFNTPKAPKPGLTYYKPIPNKDNKPVPAGQLPKTPDIDWAGYVEAMESIPQQLEEYAKSFGGLDTSAGPSKTATGAAMMAQQQQYTQSN